jgi:hypothetical protein
MPSSSLTAKERVIFRCGRDYTVRDVIDAAYFRGELKSSWEELLRGLEAEGEASAETDEEAIASAAEAFRYERNLITAEETERWLEERGLTLEDLTDYFTRAYWRTALNAKVAKPMAFRSASRELRELLAAELFFSGEFDRMTKKHSWQVAASCAANKDDLPNDVIEAERERFFARAAIGADEYSVLLEQLKRDPSWFAEMISLQANYQRQCEILLAGPAPDQELATVRLPLTRFDVEIVEIKSHDAAAEALLCVREDGMSMEAVAAQGRYPYRRATMLLEDIAEESQQKFLSVLPGEVLDPIGRGDGFQLCRVMEKAEPTLDDPLVRTRVEERIIERHFSALVSKHIEWTSASVMPTG